MIYKKIGILGPLFSTLSVVYTILYYVLLLVKFLFAKEITFLDKISMTPVSLIFIGIHFSIFLLIVFMFAVAFIAAHVGKDFMKDKKEKQRIELSMQAIRYRVLIPILYSLLPIPMYVYYITKFKILMPFIFFPVWFMFLYKYLEKKIKNYEIEVDSPMIEHHDKRMF